MDLQQVQVEVMAGQQPHVADAALKNLELVILPACMPEISVSSLPLRDMQKPLHAHAVRHSPGIAARSGKRLLCQLLAPQVALREQLIGHGQAPRAGLLRCTRRCVITCIFNVALHAL